NHVLYGVHRLSDRTSQPTTNTAEISKGPPIGFEGRANSNHSQPRSKAKENPCGCRVSVVAADPAAARRPPGTLDRGPPLPTENGTLLTRGPVGASPRD